MKEKIISLYNKNKIVFIVVSILLIALIVWAVETAFSSYETSSGDSLAKCLKNKGAKFYGTAWCPHCKSQKAAFGSDAKNLPYVECDGSNSSNAKECKDAKITGYPTWIFADGTRLSGEIPLAQLKAKVGC